MILAHAQATLPKTYTGAATPPSPKAAMLAWAVGIITEYPAAPARVRNRARGVLARTVLRWWYADADDHTPAESLAAHDVDPAFFERLLHRIATAMPTLDQPMRTWVTAATAVLNQYPPADGTVRTRNRLVCAGQANRAARAVTGLPPAAATGARPRLSTVHQAKGDQAEAVLLFMRASSVPDRSLTGWLTGTVPDPEAGAAEALRVVYVGVTRARRLLGLGVPASDRERLLTHLHSHAIPTELR